MRRVKKMSSWESDLAQLTAAKAYRRSKEKYLTSLLNQRARVYLKMDRMIQAHHYSLASAITKEAEIIIMPTYETHLMRKRVEKKEK
jgi:hypothetical protein